MKKIVTVVIRMFCRLCGIDTPHTIRDAGLDEVYTCQTCGTTKTYRVR